MTAREKYNLFWKKNEWLEEKVGRAGGEAFWKSISKRYAGSIPQNSKPVYVIPEGAKPGNIWSNTEKEILRKRGFDANYIEENLVNP